jgi:hypothetical protein
MSLSSADVGILNDFTGMLNFKLTWPIRKFINLPHQTIGLFTGNQYGKTAQIVYSYVLRFLSIHPVVEKNVAYLECQSRYCDNGHQFHIKDIPESKECPKCNGDTPNYIHSFSGHKFHMQTGLKGKDCPTCGTKITLHKRGTRVYRFCAASLPNEKEDTGAEGESAETKNTIYPALKKWLPASLILKDITARKFSITIRDVWGGNNIIVEFISYSQTVVTTAGVQRASIFMDEEPPLDFYYEQVPRLVAENGDMIIGCTPAERMSFYYDEIFMKAQTYVRTPIIAKEFGLKGIEETDRPFDIAVIQAAMDDNPTLDKRTIDKLLENIADNDPDTLAVRRFGVFRQATGRIFKDFEYSTHFIIKNRYFPNDIPYTWTHGRFIDYHTKNPWACIYMSLSPENEAFVWSEYSPSPENISIEEIMYNFILQGGDYPISVALVDAFAEAVKKDGVSVKDDMNTYTRELYQAGKGTFSFWKSWDTKSDRGRDQIKLRLKNALKCGTPFNNKQKVRGQYVRLPTLWILDTCPQAAKHINNWRYEDHMDQRARVTKDAKEAPQQKWSHYPMCMEAAFKEKSFVAKAPRPIKTYQQPRYFSRPGRGAVA